MPITGFQSEVFRIISGNRSPDSYVAGATVIHRDASSPRYSHDIDLFHDAADAVAVSSQKDAESLEKAGYQVTFTLRQPAFERATIVRNNGQTRLEWAADSAFRFFPLVADAVLGFRLHDADAATNKVLAAIGRVKVRDIIDLLHLDRTYIPLSAAVWAACGKDEGLTPQMLFQELRRRGRFNEASMEDIQSTTAIDPKNIRNEWMNCLERSEKALAGFPPEMVGALFLDESGEPVRNEAYHSTWISHYGSIKGAWPRMA
jgi:hypothetical protein